MLVKKIIKFTLPIFITSIYSTCSYGYQKSTDTTPPQITYTEERIGDRESLRVTVTATDESGIQEFRDPQGNTIIGNSITMEFDRRTDSTFIAIDNAGNQSELTIDLSWVNPRTNNKTEIFEARLNDGYTYWSSSTLREWLNSTESSTEYTSGESAYDGEKGFLSEFTEDEINAIASTKHRVLVSGYLDNSAVEGGTDGNPGHLNKVIPTVMSSYPGLETSYSKYTYKKDVDKVYILPLHEAYWYIERRGFDLKKTNQNGHYINWHLNGTSYGGGGEFSYAAFSGNCLGVLNNKSQAGVVPVINIKPNYVFDNGISSANLNIGDTVYFGSYIGNPILWRVINISDTGYPMLISEYVLCQKKINAFGGQEPRTYSDYLLDTSYELDLSDDIQYKSKNKSSDINLPKGKVLNEDALNVRHNGSFNVKLEFTDDDSGIDYIIKPNGEIVYDSYIEYEIFKNGEYVFGVMDNAGNFNKFGIPVGNINQEAELNVKASSDDWSNEVGVFVESSNTVRYTSSGNLIGGNRNSEFYGDIFSNYISYSGEKFSTSGTLKVVSYDEYVLNKGATVSIGFYYCSKGENNGFSYLTSHAWWNARTISLDELINNNEVKFNYDIEIPVSYYKDLKPLIRINSGDYNLPKYVEIQLNDIVYELKDNSDFEIISIITPDGRVFNNIKEYVDVIETEGIQTLTYKVLDNRGKYTEKTITVKVDKTNPTLDLSYNLDDIYTNKELIVSISASDSLSGLKHIRHPDGTTVSSSNSSFKITKNGTYIFQSEDVAGNIQSETLNITGIDEIVEAEESVDFAETNPTQESISYARSAVNNLPESMQKDILQDRLNSITNLEDMKLERKTVSSNLDVYIKCENLLSMSLNTNSISFDNYSGVEDMEKLGAIELTINSSLPYDLNAYLEGDIQNSDKSAAMDIDMLKIKDNSKQDYQSFINTIDKVILKEDCPSGNYIYHNIDLKLESNNAYSVDVYKTTIKFEVVQK